MCAQTSRSPSRATSISAGRNDAFTVWQARLIRSGPGSWPVDSIELERQEAEHNLLRILLGYPFLGPVDTFLRQTRNPKILDVATGTGIWAIEMAEWYPHADVLGVDSVSTQQKMVPENCDFELVDMSDLPYDKDSFDLIHLRFAHTRVNSFRALIRACIQLLKPNGRLLVFDTDRLPQLSDETTPVAAQAFHDALRRSLRHGGVKMFSLPRVMTILSGESVEVEGSDVRIPIGYGSGRMGQLGKIHEINTVAYVEAARYALCALGGYTQAEYEVLSGAYLKALKDYALYNRYHALTIRRRR